MKIIALLLMGVGSAMAFHYGGIPAVVAVTIAQTGAFAFFLDIH